MLIRTCIQNIGRIGDDMRKQRGWTLWANLPQLGTFAFWSMNRRGARRTPLPICASLLWLACNGALGAQPPEGLPNLDKRRNNVPAARPLPAEKASAFA